MHAFWQTSNFALRFLERGIRILTGNLVIFLTVLFLTLYGLVSIYSTTSVLANENFNNSFFFVQRQGVAFIIGLLFLALVIQLRRPWIVSYGGYAYIGGLFLLLLPLIPGLARGAGGASRWVSLLGFNFQPGELSKVCLILYLAGYFNRHKSQLSSFRYGILIPISLALVYVGLFLCQPDFGSSVIIVLTTVFMAFYAGANIVYFVLCLLLLGFLGCIVVTISPYRVARILAFLDPFDDASGKGYQLIQSLVAFENGGISGVGFGNSSQKLFFLPAAHTDFIMAVISEELGLLACLTIVGLFVFILFKGIELAENSRDYFSSMLILGCSLLIVLPALLNFGVVTGMLPTKGMVLPLVGFGGSNLIVNYVTFGLIFLVGYPGMNRT